MNRAPNFDGLARPYRWLEVLTFGPFLQRTRTHFLPQLSSCRRALVLGDGDGRFTAELLRRNSMIAVQAVDISTAMLAVLRESARGNANRVITEAVDLRCWQPPRNAGYDLIATHFSLDCLTTEEVASLARSVAPATASGTLWVVSEFAIPRTLFGRVIAAPLIALLYGAFRLLTGLRIRRLPDYAFGLREAGWMLQAESKHLCGLLVSQLWQRT